MHLGKHDVGAEARAGDERAARTDEHGCGGVEAADNSSDVRGKKVHHAGGGGLHDVGNDEKAAHCDEHRQHAAHCAKADCLVGFEAHAKRQRAEDTAENDDQIDPEDVAEGTHDGKTVFHHGGEAVAHEGENDEHVNIGGERLEGTVFALLRGALVAKFLRRLYADELDIGNGEQNGDEPRAH